MIESWLTAKAVVILVWFAVLAFGERLAPVAARPAKSDGARLPRNFGLWAANTLMNPLVIAPVVLAATSFDLWSRADVAPAMHGLAGLAFDLVLLDLWAYLWHRANHAWPLLWRFHRVHHLDRFLDATSAVRFHPGEVLISALARAPLLVLADVPLFSVALFDTLMFLAALFHHSNLRLPRWLECALRWVMVTPSHHWVHHHVETRDTNSNYGAVLTVWDRLFASWSPHPRTPEMAIGAGDAPDEGLLKLALRPFVGRG